jgi:hypothetical protein
MDATNLWLAPRAGMRLMVYTPADGDTERKLQQLGGLVGAGV